jgi:hypothetical protein
VLGWFSTCYPNPQALFGLNIWWGVLVRNLKVGRRLGAVTEKGISDLEEFRCRLLGRELCNRAAFRFPDYRPSADKSLLEPFFKAETTERLDCDSRVPNSATCAKLSGGKLALPSVNVAGARANRRVRD